MDLHLGASSMSLLPNFLNHLKRKQLVAYCPSYSVFCLLLRILTVVSITVMLLVCVLEFPYIPGNVVKRLFVKAQQYIVLSKTLS